MTNTLAGKVALVTGGSRGIGAAVVRRLAQDGATVAFTYSASGEKAAALAAEIEANGSMALAINADSADPAAVKAAVAQTVDRFGHLDILVNNAGILILGMVYDYDLALFDRMIAVNVRAVFVAIQAALPHMGERGPHHHYRQCHRRSYRLSGGVGLWNDQGSGCRANTRPRTRSRPAWHHSQRHPARPNRNRYEP